MDFSKEPQVNRYIKFCILFSRITIRSHGLVIRSLEFCNPFFQIAIVSSTLKIRSLGLQFVTSNKAICSLGFNPFPRIKQSILPNCNLFPRFQQFQSKNGLQYSIYNDLLMAFFFKSPCLFRALVVL